MAYEQSPARRRRHDAYKRREERRWAAKSGPVTVRHVDPATLRRDAAPPTQRSSAAPNPRTEGDG